ncbi:hypothetical protein [Ewingella americana]|uniref:hypothetical protein n=1 Tax=Ewingella americana TaxID=41202 RepID=UPI00163B40C2|nr:hypothetical protein [Ewingella americana]QMV54219.1 hypothetical protein GXP68_23415 [Ewingella americana]
MINKDYKLLVSSALKLLEGSAAIEHNLDEPIEVTLSEKIVMQIENDPFDFVTLTCAIDVESRDLSAAALWDILQTNLLRMEHPPIITSGLSDDKGIVIWSRELLSQTTAVKLYDLIVRLHNHAQGVDDWLRKEQGQKRGELRYAKSRSMLTKVL